MPSPLLPRRERLQLAAWLKRIAAGDVKLDRTVDEILAGVRAQKERIQAGMNAGREKVIAELKSRYSSDELRALRFEDFFEGGALGWAEDYAVPTGVVDECRRRGLEGLLQVRAVRLVVGMTMSLIHSQVFEGRLPKFSDAYDLWHAIQASAADVFVTRDDRFFGHLTRNPGRHRPPRRQVPAGSAGRVVGGSLSLIAFTAARRPGRSTSPDRDRDDGRGLGPRSGRGDTGRCGIGRPVRRPVENGRNPGRSCGQRSAVTPDLGDGALNQHCPALP